MFFFSQASSQLLKASRVLFSAVFFGRTSPQNFAAQNRAPWVIVEKHAQIPSLCSLDEPGLAVFSKEAGLDLTSRTAIRKRHTFFFGEIHLNLISSSTLEPTIVVKCPVDRVPAALPFKMMWTIWILTFAGHKLKDLTICGLSKWTTHTSCNRHCPTFSGIPVSGLRFAPAPRRIAMLEPKSALARPQSRSSSKKVTLELKDGEASWRNFKWNF